MRLISPEVPSTNSCGETPAFELISDRYKLCDIMLTCSYTAAADGGILPSESIHRRLALTLARAAAIPVGQILGALEQSDLMRQLAATSDPVHTPDGHLIQAVLSQDTIEKLFK